LLRQAEAEAEIGADGLGAVGQVVVGEILAPEQVDAAGHAIAEQVWLDEVQFDAARVLPVADRRLGILAAAHQVAVGDADFGDEAVGGRIPAGDRELAGGLLFDIDIDDDAVRRRARLVGDLDRLEEVQVLQPAFGAVDQCAIVGVALADIELAADDVIARADVAADVDALDVGARALFHDEGGVDRVGLGVAVAARAHIGEGVAAARGLDGHRLDALLHQVGVVDAARAELDLAAHDGRIDRAHVRDDVDLADLVLRALVDGEGDDEALLGRVVLTDRREDSHVGVAVLEVEAAQEVAVGLDAVRIVDVGGLQEAQPVADRGLDHAPEPARRISVRADEADVLHAGLLAFADVEDEVHAVVRQ